MVSKGCKEFLQHGALALEPSVYRSLTPPRAPYGTLVLRLGKEFYSLPKKFEEGGRRNVNRCGDHPHGGTSCG